MTVHVQRHAVGPLRRDNVMPGAVVVTGSGCRQIQLPGVGAENQLTVAQHVHVAVVVVAVSALVVAVTDDLAARRGGRVDPRLFGVDAGGRLRRRRRQRRSVTVEARRGVTTRYGARRVQSHAVVVGAIVGVARQVHGSRAVCLIQPVVQAGRVVPHRLPVRIGRCGGPGNGASAVDVLLAYLRQSQGSRVYRDVIDRSAEEVVARPAAVPADPPIPVVRLARRGAAVGAHESAVDIQGQAGTRKACDNLVVRAVVIGARRRDHVGVVVVHAEVQVAAGVHIDVTVIVAAVSGVAVTEAHNFSTGRTRGGEPGFFSESVRSGDGRCGGAEGRRPIEGRGRVGVATDGPSNRAGDA